MRCCMYCGRELQKDEKCNCPQSVARRRNSENNKNTSENFNAKKSASNNFNKEQTKKSSKAKKVKFKKVHNFNKDGLISTFKTFFINFLHDPVYTVSNPGAMDKTESLILVAFQGIIFSLITFFSYSGMKRNILSVLINAVGFKGLDGVKSVGSLIVCILAVTLINFILYFVITGIFYLESRYLYKHPADFWDIAVRFAISTVPVTVIGILGVVISLFSMTTVFTMLMAGMISSIILNYEGLNSVWNFSPSKTMYILSSGYLFYFGIAYNLIVSIL